MCAGRFGIAVEQGWASVDDLVANSVQNPRQCTLNAKMQNVLTMSGTSVDMSHPTFSYDALGTECLNTLNDYLHECNPEGLSTPAWKDKYWQSVLGLEHTEWKSLIPIFGQNLGCGCSASTSCRDLARIAQLWLNEGAWPGHGQVINRKFAIDGWRQTIKTPGTGFPAGNEYGYTMWLDVKDPIDPGIAHMEGLDAQCGYWSKEHEAIVISFGDGDSFEPGCPPSWVLSREAVVSSDHPLYNKTSAN